MTPTPPQRIVRSTIEGADAGTPLVEWLASRFTYFSHSSWSGMIRYGRLTLNGCKTDPSTPVAPGDRVDFDATGIEEPPANRSCRIVHQDEHLLVVDKPAELPIHPAGRYFNQTLWSLLREMTGYTKLHFINRLDRETSGLVLVGLTREAARICSSQLNHHTLAKTYMALVEGHLETGRTVVGYMSRSTTLSGAFCMTISDRPAKDAQRAETQLHPIRARNGMTLVEAIPITGRLHQIRVALSSISHPIVGDKLYGSDPTIYDRLRTDKLTAADHLALRLPRQALHACRLAFVHPASGEHVSFYSPLPPDIAALSPKSPAIQAEPGNRIPPHA